MQLSYFYPTSPQLKNIVRFFIIWESEFQYYLPQQIIPSLETGFGFTLSGKLLVDYGNSLLETPTFGTRNITKLSRRVFISNNFYNFSVRLAPNGLSKFCKENIQNAYQNNFINIENLFPVSKINILVEKLRNAKNKQEQAYFLENFLVNNLLSDRNQIVDYSINRILLSKGNLRVSDLVKEIGISERQFLRIFSSNTGLGTKEFCKLVRVRNLLAILNNPTKSNLTTRMLDAGYFDQSHGSKEFKQALGFLPKEYQIKNQNNLSDFYNY